MSKSLGNIIEIGQAANDPGAEVTRLWVALTDYSSDPPIDKQVLARVVDAYRRIRNTLRFLLANVADFDASRDAVPHAQLLEVDRWALARAAQLQAEIAAHYEKYEFQPVATKLQLFCSEDLGAFYLDVLKDRLYTTAPKSLRAPLGADRAVAHHARDAALDGAVLELHRRRGVASARAGQVGVDLLRDLRRCQARWRDDALLAKWQRIREIRDRGEPVDRGRARRRRRGLVAAGRDRDRAHRRADQTLLASARRRPAVRDHHVAGARGAAATRCAVT